MPEPRTKKRQPNHIDGMIATRVRRRRKFLGVSQEKLAEHLGLTFQQIQKYESASNRISAGKLYEIANVLGVPVAYFYEDVVDGQVIKYDLDIEEHLTNPTIISFVRKVAAISDDPETLQGIHNILDGILKSKNVDITD